MCYNCAPAIEHALLCAHKRHEAPGHRRGMSVPGNSKSRPCYCACIHNDYDWILKDSMEAENAVPLKVLGDGHAGDAADLSMA